MRDWDPSSLAGAESGATSASRSVMSETKLVRSRSEENISTDQGITRRVKLPKLELPKFSGKNSQWQEFWDGFRSAVHDDESLAKVDKFKYSAANRRCHEQIALELLITNGHQEWLSIRWHQVNQVITTNDLIIISNPLICTANSNTSSFGSHFQLLTVAIRFFYRLKLLISSTSSNQKKRKGGQS